MAKKRSRARSRGRCSAASPAAFRETHNQSQSTRSPAEFSADSQSSSSEPQPKRRASGTQIVAFKSSTIHPVAEWQTCALCDSLVKAGTWNEHFLDCLAFYQRPFDDGKTVNNFVATTERSGDQSTHSAVDASNVSVAGSTCEAANATCQSDITSPSPVGDISANSSLTAKEQPHL